MLKVSQVTRSYGSFIAVDNVSFAVGKGEIVGLLGHNGAGKTTIMRMISGYLEPDRGEVCVDGINLGDNPKAIQRALGYLPENLPLYPEMIVADYLDYAAELKGLRGNEKTSEIRRAIASTEIGSKLLAPIATLSRGYKQRVGVAQVILGRPKNLILDEPTNGLDPEQTQHMRDLIRSIACDATVILSTHIMQEVEAMCSRVLMLRAGALAVDAELQALKQSNQLILETSLPENDVTNLTNSVGVETVTALENQGTDGSMVYRLVLAVDADEKRVCADVAATICRTGGELYRLLPEQRDLETLFREVNENLSSYKGVRHAA